MSLSKCVIMYFPACDANYTFPYWCTERNMYTVSLVCLICLPACDANYTFPYWCTERNMYTVSLVCLICLPAQPVGKSMEILPNSTVTGPGCKIGTSLLVWVLFLKIAIFYSCNLKCHLDVHIVFQRFPNMLKIELCRIFQNFK